MSVSDQQTQTIRRHRWLRWFLAGLIFVIILIYVIIETTWLVRLSRPAWIALDILVLVAFGVIVYLGIWRILRLSNERSLLQQRLDDTERQLTAAHQRHKTVFHNDLLFA